MADDEEVGDAGAPRDRGAYLSQAYINAFGKYDEPDWDPEQGFAANRIASSNSTIITGTPT